VPILYKNMMQTKAKQ